MVVVVILSLLAWSLKGDSRWDGKGIKGKWLNKWPGPHSTVCHINHSPFNFHQSTPLGSTDRTDSTAPALLLLAGTLLACFLACFPPSLPWLSYQIPHPHTCGFGPALLAVAIIGRAEIYSHLYILYHMKGFKVGRSRSSGSFQLKVTADGRPWRDGLWTSVSFSSSSRDSHTAGIASHCLCHYEVETGFWISHLVS